MDQLVSPEAPIPQPPTSIQPQFHSNKNKFIFLIGAILLLITISSVMYYVGQSHQTPILPSPLPLTSPQPSLDEMNEWKTYRNEEYGFEFKYPDNWNIDSDGQSYQRFQMINNEEAQFPGYIGSAGVFFTIEKTLDNLENKGNIFESMYSSTSRCPEMAGEIDLGDTANVYCLTGKEVQTKAGIWKEAVECSAYEFYAARTAPENCPHQFWLDTDNYFYYFNFHVFEPIKENSDIDILFDQILASFEFVDFSDQPAQAELNNIPNISSGIPWNEPTPYEGIWNHDLTIFYNDELFLTSIKGKEWKATMINLTSQEREKIYNDFHSTIEDFENLGWTWPAINDYKLQGASADSPSGGIYGLVGYNNGNIRVVSWLTNTKYKTGEMPLSHGCPCDVDFRYFLSDIVPFNDLISQLDKK